MFSTLDTLGFELPYYGFMVGLGILACFLLIKLVTMKKRDHIEGIEYVCIGLAGGIGAFIMAHIVYAIAQFDKLVYVLTHLDRVFGSLQMFMAYMIDVFGGMVFYGGLIGACIGAFIYMKVAKLDVRSYADTLAPCIPLFHAFGRIGCFLAGCCYGIESNFGVTYHHSLIVNANGVSRLPIQLFESVENVLICLVLLAVLCKCSSLKKGTLIWIYGLIYPVVRFINEFFRGDITERGYFGPLSTSQWISIFLFVISAVALIAEYSSKPKQNTAVNKEVA